MRTSEEAAGLTHALQWRIRELGQHKLDADMHILKLDSKLIDIEEQCDAACADAERLEWLLRECSGGISADGKLGKLIADALATHRAASGKAVTG